MLEFLPEKTKVAKGTTVTWSIAGPEPHSVTFVPPGTTVPPSTQSDPSLFAPTPASGPYDGTTLVKYSTSDSAYSRCTTGSSSGSAARSARLSGRTDW